MPTALVDDRLAEGEQHLADRRPLGGVARGHRADQRSPVLAQLLRDERVGLQAGHRRGDRLPREGELTGEAFEQHEPERIDVAGRADEVAEHLLGTQVGRGAGGVRLFVAARLRGVERDAEVGEPRVRTELGGAIFDDQHIRRLDVAVYDSTGMYVVERLGEVVADLGDRSRGESRPREEVFEVAAGDEFHHEIGVRLARRGVVDPGVEQRDDPVVAQSREHSKFRLVLNEIVLAGCRGTEELEGDIAPELFVSRVVDGGHSAASDHSDRTVPSIHEDVGRRAVGIDHRVCLLGC